MILFAILIIISGVLRQFYNSADSIIVGKFSGDENALGAAGILFLSVMSVCVYRKANRSFAKESAF